MAKRLALVVLLAAGCGGDDDDDDDVAIDAAVVIDAAAPDAAAPDAAAPDAGGVDAGGVDAGGVDGAVYGSCADPLPLSLGVGVVATTDTPASAHIWSAECADTSIGEYPVGPETVFELTVPSTQMVSYILTPLASTVFGVYVRYDCGVTGAELFRYCDSNLFTASVRFDRLTPPGTFYVLADDFGGLGMGPGEFTLVAQPIAMPSCHGQVPVVLPVESAPHSVSGDTSLGVSMTTFDQVACGSAFDTDGAERSYAFALAAPATVTIAATPTSPADSDLAVYLRRTCDDADTQVQCGIGNGGAAATISAALEAGEYYLFVDDFAGSIDEPQTYDLTLAVE